MSVLLDGKWVEEDTINPEKHTFIGTFRPPTPPHLSLMELSPCPLFTTAPASTKTPSLTFYASAASALSSSSS